MTIKEIDEHCKKNPIELFTWMLTHNGYLNLPLMLLKDKVLPLTLGDNIIFDSEDDAIINFLEEWSERVQLFNKCKLIIGQQSLAGKSVAFLMRESDGELDIYIPSHIQMTSVAKVNEREKLAVIYTNTTKGDNASFKKIVIGAGVAMIQDYSVNESLRAQDASIDKSKLEPIGEPYSVKLDTDFFPVKEFVNIRLPDFGINNTSYFSGLPDWWVGRKLMFDIEEGLVNKYKERIKNQTRVMGSMDVSKMDALSKQEWDPNNPRTFLKGDGDLEDLLQDFYINSNSNAYIKNGEGVAYIQGDPKLDIYNSDIQSSLSYFYRTCGYNFISGENENYENKTKSIMNNDLDIQTTGAKQKEMYDGLYKLIDMVLADKNLAYKNADNNRNYSIKFVSNSIVDKVQKMDLVERQMNLGILDPIEAIQSLNSVNRKIAEEKYEKAKQHAMEKKIMDEYDPNSDYDDGSDMEKDVI